jgi:large subunit ribosomal protein L18e
MPHPTGPTNPSTEKLIWEFGRMKEAVFKKLSKELKKPARKKKGVNVSKIESAAQKNENVAVPGKVLSIGEITKPVNVYALSFSKQAKEKIIKAGGKCFQLSELKNAKEKARIII